MIWFTAAVIATLALFVVGYMNLPKFGRAPRGQRLARIERSPNYRDGEFRNQELTPQLTSDKGMASIFFDFIFEKRERNRPSVMLPTIKTDLRALPDSADLVVWFGHSSYFIQSAGQRLLVDPVFEDASPVPFFNRAFDGTKIYTADDMPDIDYLIITHDHWDHLDYATVRELKDRIGKVVCPLGVGEYFEYWGFDLDRIIEMDWDQSHTAVDSTIAIHTLPARHFSGRTFRSNQTLWASYMVVTPRQTIYLSGDGGYGKHFKRIAEQFPSIDMALIENGQYNADWRLIHLMPENLGQAIEDINARHVIAGHNSKYALAKHSWDEPLNNASQYPTVLTPMIGQVVDLNDTIRNTAWWKNIE